MPMAKTFGKMLVTRAITLNVNGLNAPQETRRIQSDTRTRPNYALVINCVDGKRRGVKGWEELYHGNTHQKKAGAAVFTSGGGDSKTNSISGDREGHPTVKQGRFIRRHTRPNYVPSIILIT